MSVAARLRKLGATGARAGDPSVMGLAAGLSGKIGLHWKYLHWKHTVQQAFRGIAIVIFETFRAGGAMLFLKS